MPCDNCSHCQQSKPEKVNIVAEAYGSLPCHLRTFTINGVEAHEGDFVSMESDGCPTDCEGYDCHDMHAEKLSLACVRKKIKEGPLKDLTNDQIKEIQDKLVDMLYVGDCGWCV